MTHDRAKICFAIMPFNSKFNDISDIIRASAEECGLTFVRGDHRNQPGSIMPQILHDIRHASVIVTDITDNNPNVFYELGIAHQIKGPGQVVIITHCAQDSPYDIHEFRRIRYEHTESGRAELRRKLPACLNEALSSQDEREVWNIIRGPLERTRMIVRDLGHLLLTNPNVRMEDVTIRMISSLGSLAISHRETDDPELGRSYNTALLDERNSLRDALCRGARLKLLLHPPRTFTKRMLVERLKHRYSRLIGLLEDNSDIDDPAQRDMDLKAIRQTEILLTPVPMPHLIIIGDRVAYEGMKRGGSRGYAMTHCETDQRAILALIADFEAHFKECRDLLPTQSQVLEQLKGFFEEAKKNESAGPASCRQQL
jgi:hypothetical protein